jgi:hypothetical protein
VKTPNRNDNEQRRCSVPCRSESSNRRACPPRIKLARCPRRLVSSAVKAARRPFSSSGCVWRQRRERDDRRHQRRLRGSSARHAIVARPFAPLLPLLRCPHCGHCESTPSGMSPQIRLNTLILLQGFRSGGVPSGADWDASRLSISEACSKGCCTLGRGPASVLIHSRRHAQHGVAVSLETTVLHRQTCWFPLRPDRGANPGSCDPGYNSAPHHRVEIR